MSIGIADGIALAQIAVTSGIQIRDTPDQIRDAKAE